jgi:hypothetical protein
VICPPRPCRRRKHPANTSRGFLEPHSKCQFSDFIALASSRGAVQKSLICPAASIAHAATRKTVSAAVRAVADRTRRPPWQPISCAMLCSGRLHPPRCNVSHRATLPRPTYHFGDHASLRDSLCNNHRPVLLRTSRSAPQSRLKPLPIARDCSRNQAYEKSGPREAGGLIKNNSNLFGLPGFSWSVPVRLAHRSGPAKAKRRRNVSSS